MLVAVVHRCPGVVRHGERPACHAVRLEEDADHVLLWRALGPAPLAHDRVEQVEVMLHRLEVDLLHVFGVVIDKADQLPIVLAVRPGHEHSNRQATSGRRGTIWL